MGWWVMLDFETAWTQIVPLGYPLMVSLCHLGGCSQGPHWAFGPSALKGLNAGN